MLAALLLSGAAEPQPDARPATDDADVAPAPPERQKPLDEQEALARLDALSLDDVEEVSPPPAEEEEPLELDLPPNGAGPGQACDSSGMDEGRAREMRKRMLEYLES